jgi:hypothetical protein
MAVLVEAISVIVRLDAVKTRFSGGWREFIGCVKNSTLCYDECLARVGFMSPNDADAFVKRIVGGGLTFLRDGQAVDIAIVDQIRGPIMPVDWLEFAYMNLAGTENKVAICWVFEGERRGDGIHMSLSADRTMTLATPDGWVYERSLSANSKFVKNEEMQENVKLMRHENGQDIYLDLSTGKELYIGRTKGNKS